MAIWRLQIRRNSLHSMAAAGKCPGKKAPNGNLVCLLTGACFSAQIRRNRYLNRVDAAESLLESRRCGGIVTWCDRYGARRLGPGGWRLAAGFARGLRQRRRRAERSPASCEEMMIREVKEANLVGSTISTYPVAEGGRDGNLVTEPKFPSPPAWLRLWNIRPTAPKTRQL